ncbi:hypothetical protein MRB53_011207 [Persea americana]|uniref:Uncharacterized protein n=1 Tax=Persea americana TaxID=3435 RepID=A0ACC2LU82_PERAE|nr:hypothetical protein MRB53_011207 [Persea americana]
MDTNISSWILEFLLRQPIDDWIPCTFISLLPQPDSDLRLKKTILLRRISSLLSKTSISESILKTLEIMEEIHHMSGTETHDSMRRAYSSVAVECAAKFLREEPEDYSSFADAVNRVWKGKIGVMRRWGGGVGLVSDGLWDLEKEMLAAVENPAVRRKLRGRESRKEALDAVRAFLEEAEDELGPSFLEFAAEALLGKGEVGKNTILVENLKDGRVGKRGAVGLSEDDALDAEKGDFEGTRKKCKLPLWIKDVRKGSLHPSEMDASVSVPSRDPSIATMGKVGTARVQNKFDILPSSEVSKAQEALKSSSVDLQTVVEDPLPDALEIATGILSNMGQANQKESENNKNQLDVDTNNASVEKHIDDNCMGDAGNGKQNAGKCDGKSWPGFMARNRTAHTYEWDDDSIESPSDASPNGSRKLCLPSPERKAISPLKKHDMNITNFTRRRKIKKWSLEEEELLREAVKEYGTGNWKPILKRYSDKFEERTAIDLKDKWRNMTRYSSY